MEFFVCDFRLKCSNLLVRDFCICDCCYFEINNRCIILLKYKYVGDIFYIWIVFILRDVVGI